MLKKLNTNNLRLFLKGLVTAWVPVVVLAGVVTWDAETTAIIMAASVATIDGFFRVFGVSDPTG